MFPSSSVQICEKGFFVFVFILETTESSEGEGIHGIIQSNSCTAHPNNPTLTMGALSEHSLSFASLGTVTTTPGVYLVPDHPSSGGSIFSGYICLNLP